MSVEALVIASIVKEGASGLRKVYQQGVSSEDFVIYEEEFVWIEEKIGHRLPLNPRVFRRNFPDFEWLIPNEPLKDLLADLKNERAFTEMQGLLESLGENLKVDNAIEKAAHARDFLADVTRLHSASSDFALISGWRDHLKEQKQKRALRAAGVPPGLSTGLQWIDHHWDGLVGGRFIVTLGRPGEGKSTIIAQFAKEASLTKHTTILFSPEMNRDEHKCRLDTMMSADPRIKEALGLRNSFRNRALMSGIGYNMKSYKRFLEYLEAECGEIVLMTKTHRGFKMTVPFIESKIADIGPDLVIIDPIYKLAAQRGRVTRTEEVADIADAIQDLAETYNIPIVVTNQAHRQMTGKDRAPDKDTSFNSDVPIQEADHVIGVKHVAEEHRLLVRCSKSRFSNGDFAFECKFLPNTGKIEELTQPTGNYYNGHDDSVESDELKEIVDNATTGEEEKVND